MKLLLVLTLASVVLLADNPRSRFQAIQEEARSAAAQGDWETAETKYLVLLDMAGEVGAPPLELYANVVTPLGSIYKKTGNLDRLEALYLRQVERARSTLARGLAEADLGFFYQDSETSAERFRGEERVQSALRTFENCSAEEKPSCLRRLIDTAGLQGAIFFQQGKYAQAEALFRRVLAAPESEVQNEVLLVSIHALRGILILRKDFAEARALEARAAALEARDPQALARLRGATRD